MKKRSEITDDRVKFANSVCDLIWNSCGGNPNSALIKLKEYQIRSFFEEHVRNIHQFVETEIPLFWLYDIEKSGADNYGISEDEYLKRLRQAKSACFEYYIQ